MKTKYVRLIEKRKRGTADIYDGIEIKRTKENITIYGAGPLNDDPLQEHTLDLEDYELVEQTKDEVAHFFRLSLLKMESDCLDKEFSFIESERKLKKARELSAKYLEEK